MAFLRAWVCPPCPYTCHTLFVSHPLMGTTLIQKPKATMSQPRKHHLSPENPMMSIGHTMISFPHTSGGNLLTQKIAQLALNGLNHIHTSFSYLFSLIFDLHNYVLNLCSLKNLKNIKKGLKTPQKGQKAHKRAKTLTKGLKIPKRAKNIKRA